MPDLTQRPLHNHRNHYLFADYYLDHRLGELPEWQSADSAPVLAELRQRWAVFIPHHDNEAQTEDEWIRPVLKTLGHVFNVQTPLKTPFGTRKPDYLLFPDEASRQAAKAKSGPFDSQDLRATALAVADAKAWDRPLDQTVATGTKKGQTLSENPSLQIYIYVQHSGLAWGILTNGRLWRLVHRDTAEKLDVYYEVDLPALLEQNDPEAFNYFYYFFRRDAFIDQPGAPGWLTRALEQSRAYARGVSDSLRDQVYEALRHLAQGFLDFPANGLTPDPATLKAIYDHSLIVLYRLLFILYAESRGLLPVPANAFYSRSYSLDALKKRLARELDHGQPAVPSMTTFWQQLRQLWQVIDQGNPDLEVPAYNGGLFKARPGAFLESYQVGDVHLRQAIDLLARTVDPQTRQRVFVDYRDLEIRHLGSIYEGLLEYQVRVADQPLTVKVEKGREIYLPSPVGGEVQPGQVYLTTDKGERHATGSYYTPDYIVKYIVEQTVRPVLDRVGARLAGAEVSEASQDLAGLPRPSDPAALAETILSVNLLDPSMGSGHFLVEATDFLARSLVELGLPPPADAAGESDLAYWRRRVAQNCIYGVDVNPLAVELAKLSLWLTTVAKGKPLSFLDHHLRCGNSLIGSRVADLPLETNRPDRSQRPVRSNKKQQQAEAAARAAGQLSMLDDSAFAGSMRTAAGFMSQIETLRSDTLADVQQAEGLYRQVVEEVTARARQVADVWTARAFGLPELDQTVWNGLVRYLLHGGFELPQYGRILAQARDLAARHRFFHWELEFPEVFFGESGQLLPGAGFDAVVGNPPYVRQEYLTPLKSYLESTFASYHSTADLYLYFYEQGIHLLGEKGRLAYVSSGTFARANFARSFRTLLPTVAQIETIIDFGENQPFEGAEMVRPSILTLQKGAQEKPFRSLFISAKIPPSLDLALAEEGIDCLPIILEQPEWIFQSETQTQLSEKILKQGTPLIDFISGQIYYGIKTGLNEAFLIDQTTRDGIIQADPACIEMVKPMLRGEDLRPWYQEDEGRWLILIPAGWTRSNFGADLGEEEAQKKVEEHFPAIMEHLNQFAAIAGKRQDKGDYWWELRPCVYYDAFEKPKIFWPDIAKLPRFSWDDQKQYINNKGYIIPDPHPFLLGVLQSRVIWFAVSQICQPLRLRAGLWQYQMFTQFTSRLPIPDAPAAEREAIGGLAMTLTEQARARYQLHRQSRHRLLDLRPAESSAGLNQKLTAWWELDFPALRAELQKVFKRDIPLVERDDWEAWLKQRRSQHQQLTAEIIRLETELNQRVYALFDLTPAEIELIEASTKYRYGEV